MSLEEALRPPSAGGPPFPLELSVGGQADDGHSKQTQLLCQSQVGAQVQSFRQDARCVVPKASHAYALSHADRFQSSSSSNSTPHTRESLGQAQMNNAPLLRSRLGNRWERVWFRLDQGIGFQDRASDHERRMEASHETCSTLRREVENEHRLAEEYHDELDDKGREIEALTAALRNATTRASGSRSGPVPSLHLRLRTSDIAIHPTFTSRAFCDSFGTSSPFTRTPSLDTLTIQHPPNPVTSAMSRTLEPEWLLAPPSPIVWEVSIVSCVGTLEDLDQPKGLEDHKDLPRGSKLRAQPNPQDVKVIAPLPAVFNGDRAKSDPFIHQMRNYIRINHVPGMDSSYVHTPMWMNGRIDGIDAADDIPWVWTNFWSGFAPNSIKRLSSPRPDSRAVPSELEVTFETTTNTPSKSSFLASSILHREGDILYPMHLRSLHATSTPGNRRCLLGGKKHVNLTFMHTRDPVLQQGHLAFPESSSKSNGSVPEFDLDGNFRPGR
ncbi:hypothetical protein F5148DRAFT_1375052 [Russula earlei]|uniref:Uncharacterized protein n=1 Tax=Russula earlei TaxID=71964 RepID=A0ACC0UDJ5_9AGAM|nr:hypothetical protein F5148DRAFT_1375052 [Russula earlei]